MTMPSRQGEILPSWTGGEQPFLSIVIPAYDEARRIAGTLRAVIDYLKGQDYSWEIVVVDDGSTDQTADIIHEFCDNLAAVRLLRREHRGKGHAVKTGMLAARGKYRFLCDADLSMPIQELAKFLPHNLGDYDIAVASREAPGARRLDEPLLRHLMGRVFNLVVRLFAVRGLRDTQCGFKCFRAEAAWALFSLQKMDGFGFDVEVLFLAQRRKLRIKEVPIVWYHRGQSKVSPLRDTVRMFRDVLGVRWNQWRGCYRISSQPSAEERV